MCTLAWKGLRTNIQAKGMLRGRQPILREARQRTFAPMRKLCMNAFVCWKPFCWELSKQRTVTTSTSQMLGLGQMVETLAQAVKGLQETILVLVAQLKEQQELIARQTEALKAQTSALEQL